MYLLDESRLDSDMTTPYRDNLKSRAIQGICHVSCCDAELPNQKQKSDTQEENACVRVRRPLDFEIETSWPKKAFPDAPKQRGFNQVLPAQWRPVG